MGRRWVGFLFSPSPPPTLSLAGVPSEKGRRMRRGTEEKRRNGFAKVARGFLGSSILLRCSYVGKNLPTFKLRD